MDERFIEIYTKLRKSINCWITINYYSETRRLENQCFKLLDVKSFLYILVKKGQQNLSFNFFGPDTLIESITIKGATEPIYCNPYIQKHIDKQSRTINYEKIKEEFFGNWQPNNEDLEKREKFLSTYAKRGDFKFEELFFSDKQRKEFDDFLELITKELKEYAKKHGLDSSLIPIGKGQTTLAYCIGDKVIKIGKPRTYPTIPYCEYVLQPIVNIDIEFDYIPLHIEITEKVITLKDKPELKNEFEDIISDLEKKLPAIGLKYNDLLVQNIGILMRDNRIHYDSISFETGDEIATSIKGNSNLRIRKKGESIILDLDVLEVVDIHKYCEYLRSVGFNEEKIKEVKDFYGREQKRK